MYIYIAIAVVVIIVLVYTYQEKFIFIPTKTIINPTNEVILGKLTGLWLGARGGYKGTVVYFHGNAGNAELWEDAADVFRDLGYDVYMLDYPGYGNCPGSITSERGLINDCLEALEAVLATLPSGEKLIVVGTSIGTGIAAKVAAKMLRKNLVTHLILNCPYTSIPDLMGPAKFLKPLLRYTLNTLETLKEIDSKKVHIFHGEGDSLIPKSHSLSLRDAGYNVEIIPGCGHNDLIHTEEYKREITNLLG